ncbi:unnamed protein product [Sphagnum troendelagicum]
MWTCFARILEWVCSGFSHDGNQEDPSIDSLNVSTPTLINPNEPSSSNYDVLHTYDVFLNHRGPDVKTTFVAHLYDALCIAGFHPFLDAKSLIKGQHAFNSINEALSGVRVHIAVFSKGYAKSKYCLNELCDMLESGKDILPIFYDVEPEHLRRPHHGPFAAAFRKHLKRGRKDNIKRWEEALLKVANITGFRLNEVNGDESQLKKKVVMKVQNIAPLHVFQQVQHGVGLNGSMVEVVNQLGLVGILGIVGIVGMGGIGKTTLAKAVYNEYLKGKHFERQSFLHNVRTTDLPSLQKQLVHDLFGEELKFPQEFHDCFIRLSRDRKVFVVIDDIDDINQFDQLIPSLPKFMSQGSQILVTSRDQHVLNYITIQGSIGKSNLYEVPMLDVDNAHQLFNWHAFHDKWASDGFRDLAKEVVNACNGLPLALEVMGAYLFDKKDPKHKVVWKEAIRSLNMDPGAIDQKLQNMFNISYEGLSSQANKLMLLDIACFMINRHESMAMSFWESCILCPCPSSKSPHSSLMKLIEKSLVKKDENGYLQMHDVIRDMARDVVKKESLQEVGERSHLWDFIETKEVLHKDKGSAKIRGLHMSGSKLHTPLPIEKFATMTSLHLLFLDDCQVEGDFSTLSKELRWLSWCNLPIVELPTNLNLPNLVVLNLKLARCKHLKTLPKSFGCLQELEHLDMSENTSLEMLPESFGQLKVLKYLNLAGCSTLKTLPSSIGALKALKLLDLAHCFMLEALPNSIGNLSNLKTLHLNYCKNLKELPMTFGNLQNLAPCKLLERLVLRDCIALERLPENIGELSKLKVLRLRGCSTLRTLPSSIGALKALQDLDLAYCFMLEALPNSIGNLSNLKSLYLNYCKSLKELPMTFGNLQNLRGLWAEGASFFRLPNSFSHLLNLEAPCKLLERLVLRDCIALERLPENIGELSKLKVLRLRGCSTLRTLPSSIGALKALQDLDLAYCFMLEALPNNIDNQSNLKTLCLNYCKNLKELPMTFGNLQNLKDLRARGASFFRLPNSFSHLLNLEVLDLDYCMNLHDLPPSISGLVKLKKLCMRKTKVEKLPEDIGQLKSLKMLKLVRCKHLKTLPQSFGCLDELEHLDMFENTSLEMLPESFGQLQALNHLNLGGCSFGKGIGLPSNVGDLINLKSLVLNGNLMTTIPESFKDLNALVTLKMLQCPNLVVVQALPSKLERLYIGNCPKLTNIPCLGNLNTLKYLILNDCPILTHLQGLDFPPCKLLEQLLLRDCIALERLPENIGELSKLKCLDLYGCSTLKKLPYSIGQLQALQELDLGFCVSLETLPDSSGNLSKFKKIWFYYCKNLKGLPMTFGNLQILVYLLVKGTSLSHLPDSFSKLFNLEELYLYDYGHQTIVVNSNVLDKNKSKNLQEEFLKLNLENNLDYNDHFHVVPSVIASSLSYYCDYCYEEILIQRWSCSMCGGFDLCDKCYEMRFNYQEYKGHVNSHPMFSYLV